MTTAIVVLNTDGTNVAGYREEVMTNGAVSFVDADGQGNATLPPPLLDRFIDDVAAARPLAQIPAIPPCAKSASFGTSLYLMIGADRSPDLSCPHGPVAQALADDIAAINAFLHVRATLRQPSRPF